MSEQRPDRPKSGKNGNGAGGGGNRPPAGGNGGLRFGRGLFGWVLFVALAVMLFMLLQKGQTLYARIALSDFYSRLENNAVATLTIEGDKILGEFRQPEPIGEKGASVGKFQTELPTGAGSDYRMLEHILSKRGEAKVVVENSQNLVL